MEDLHSRLKSIISKTSQLVLENIKDFTYSIDYVAITTKSNDEYDFYASELDKLATLIYEMEGVLFKLNSGLTIENFTIEYIRVVKPKKDESRIGYIDLKDVDFTDAKKRLKDLDNYEEFKASDNKDVEVVGLSTHEISFFIAQTPLIQELEHIMKNKTEKDTQPSNEVHNSELEKQLQEEKEKRMKALADLQNFRKRMEQERATFGAIANMSLIQELLEVFDDIGLALNDAELTLETAKSSLVNARQKLEKTVQSAGVERIEIQVGDEYDKEKMEAISTIPDENNKGKVIAVIKSAYKYSNQDGILSPAKVIVGK